LTEEAKRYVADTGVLIRQVLNEDPQAQAEFLSGCTKKL
jgi:predicted regulator of amino acid metabolism with ACT domain